LGHGSKREMSYMEGWVIFIECIFEYVNMSTTTLI
jgi:hypothetical protein